MSSNSCGSCGNLIPSWAYGSCPVCQRIEQEHIKYGSRKAHNQRTFKSYGSVVLTPHDLRSRLECFNQLLRDVYDDNIRLGQILANHGVPQAQIQIWRDDQPWLEQFLERLELNLSAWLQRVIPGRDSRILRDKYGLGKYKPQPTEDIACSLHMRIVDVENDYQATLSLLRDRTGRAAIETAVLEASEQL